jgi:hypothetical protein
MFFELKFWKTLNTNLNIVYGFLKIKKDLFETLY